MGSGIADLVRQPLKTLDKALEERTQQPEALAAPDAQPHAVHGAQRRVPPPDAVLLHNAVQQHLPTPRTAACAMCKHMKPQGEMST